MKQLVKGYIAAVRQINPYTEEPLEIRYAVTHDGAIYAANPERRSDDFNRPHFVWMAIPKLPDHAEFIGNYPKPRQIS